MTDKAFKLLRKPVIKYSAVQTSVYVFLTILTVTFAEILHTRGGGGRLVEPSGRSSLWRSNSTLQPVNENDHRNNCGGFEVSLNYCFFNIIFQIFFQYIDIS